MLRRIGLVAMVGLVILSLSACDGGLFPSTAKVDPATDDSANQEAPVTVVPIGNLLYKPTVAPDAPEAPAPVPPATAVVDPVVIHDCRLTVFDKQDVPSQQEGVLVFIGTEMKPNEEVPPGRKVKEVEIGNQKLRLRQLKEGDDVEDGQLLAIMDNRLATADLHIKEGKLKVAEADFKAADKTKDEARSRYLTQLQLRNSVSGKATSQEDVNGAKLVMEKSAYEADSKHEAIGLAQQELNQSSKLVEMHQIRSTMKGRIKTIYKLSGESIKKLDPVFQIQNIHQLRAEGQVNVQQVFRVHKGMKAQIEPSEAQDPQLTLNGHLQEVTSVAVSKDDKNPLICSASEDGTVRVWDRTGGREARIWRHNAPVRAVACTPPAASPNLCLTGTSDGTIRLWDLDGKENAPPLYEKKGQHQGGVRCLAFAPDGKTFATGGEDGKIYLWDTAKGAPLYQLPAGHRTAVTSVQFTPRSQLVSSGRDNHVRLWTLGEKGANQATSFPRRLGDVTQLGASPDGSQILFDQGKTLRLLSLPKGRTLGILENPSGASNFRALALFSPDGKLILTASSAENKLQLWRTPAGPARRGTEVRQLVPPGGTEHAQTTCAAFSPTGSFVVTGGQDRQVLVWSVPNTEEVERMIPAEVTLVEQAVESAAGQVKIRAELTNPDDRLLPGGTVTLVINPRQ